MGSNLIVLENQLFFLPQAAETQTPQPSDVVGEFVL